MSAWRRLDEELDAWRAAGRCATLWCRDDDACGDSPALRRLLEIARAAGAPVALAVIPAAMRRDLVEAVAPSGIATVLQHGYAHRNHAPPQSRKWELGAHRPVRATLGELERGLSALRLSFGEQFLPMLVPPWNRIDDGVVGGLAESGFRGLSCLGPRAAARPAAGIAQCNVHVDLIAWRRERAFVGVEAALERLLDHLRARREGRVDASEPSGILTHHLDMSAAGWQFLADLMARTKERGAAWLDARAAFG
ncbi:MAG: polysaccharide deacetylase family protein [Clostridia bacterium]